MAMTGKTPPTTKLKKKKKSRIFPSFTNSRRAGKREFCPPPKSDAWRVLVVTTGEDVLLASSG